MQEVWEGFTRVDENKMLEDYKTSSFKKDILNIVYLSEFFGLPEVASFWESVVKLNDWQQHRRRLIEFGESKYQNTHFYVGPKGGVYYITYRGTKVYC